METEILLPYQKAWLADQAKVKVCEKSRRIGLSWAEACDAVLTAMDPGKNGSNYYYISYNKEMTRQFIDDCAHWARILNVAASEMNEEILSDEGREVHVYNIDFAAHRIQALSGHPRNLRSKQGTVCIDEAAFVDDVEEIIKAAMALLMWGGRVRIISTHNGDENPFNEIIQEVRKGTLPYSLHKITLDDALAQGLYRRICEKDGKTYSEAGEEAYRDELIKFYRDNSDEELFCIPKRSGGRYIPRAVIEACQRPDIPVVRWSCKDEFTMMSPAYREAETRAFCEEQLKPLLRKISKRSTSLGGDFGRSGDLSVFWLLQEMNGQQLDTPFVVELRNVPFEQQRQILFYIIDGIPNFRAASLDARGNGQYLAEVAAQRYGAAVEQVAITSGWYLDNMPRVKANLEDGKTSLPLDPDIRDDIRAIQVIRGVPCIPDKHNVGADGSKRHADSAVALCMAVHASRRDSIGPTEMLHGPQREMEGLLEFY